MECIRSTGFCGLDIPVCSDRRFVQLIESSICPRRLINILPVCANGIDMVCVPGSDVHLHTQSEQSLRSLLLDMVTLAEQLGKPLISRILPVPGKKKGDRVNFGFVTSLRLRLIHSSTDTFREQNSSSPLRSGINIEPACQLSTSGVVTMTGLRMQYCRN